MGKRSTIWLHFKTTDDKNVGVCHHCGAKISVKNCSTANLGRHLKLKHPTIPIDNSPNNVPTHSSVPENSSREGGEERASTTKECVVSSSSSSTILSTHQRSIKNSIDVIKPLPITKTKILHEQFLKMIVKEYYPFSIVEDEEFMKFLRLLNPSYKPPTRKTLTQTMLPVCYAVVKAKILTQMKDAKAVALTTDGWTCIQGASYISVTAHFIDPSTTALKCALLDCSRFDKMHTSENISAFLLEMCKEWGIENKVTAIVTDNASKVSKAVLQSNFRNIGCFAHTLNLVAQAGIDLIQNVRSKAKALVQHFKHSSKALGKLEEIQKQMSMPQLKLKQDVPTRWNSTYEMFSRLLQNKEPLISCCALLQLPKHLIFDADEWEILKQSVEVLSPFYHVTQEVSAEKSLSLSKSFMLMNILRKRMVTYQRSNNLHPLVSAMVTKTIEDFNSRMKSEDAGKVLGRIKESWDNSDIINQAAFLDPRFKQKSFVTGSKLDEVRSKVINRIHTPHQRTPTERDLMDQPVTQESKKRKHDLWDDFDSDVNDLPAKRDPMAAAIVEYDKYLAEPLLQREEDPLKWWNERKNIYPLLYSLVLKILCIPATSVPCERIFSKDGNIKTEKRSRLLPEHLSQILFLNQNM